MTMHEPTFSRDAVAAGEPVGVTPRLDQIHPPASRNLGQYLRRLLRGGGHV
jgi:hypothetical protein